MAPWVHMNINPNGDVYPCCLLPICESDTSIDGQEDNVYEQENPLKYIASECEGHPRDFRVGSLMNESLQEIWNNDKMRELRRNMMAGKKSSFCTSCYKEEEVGHSSLRNTMNNNYSKHYKYVKETKEDGTFERFNLVYWDFRLNNICNFKCRMCGPGCSSAWEQEMRKEFDIKGEFPKIDMDMVHHDIEPLYDIVEEVYFAGGEPLIADHHYEILNKLIEKGKTNVPIRYNTNFSTLIYKGTNVLDLWDKFEDVHIMISLDGIGKRGELIRKGFDWQKFLNNFKLFRSRFPDNNVRINFVVQAMNCFHVMDAHKELYLRGIIKSWDEFSLCILHNPDFMSVLILDSKSRKLLGEKIKYHIENYLVPAKAQESIKQYISILKLLSTDKKDNLIPHFKAYMSALDSIRNENSLEVFPELERVLGND